MQYVKQPNKDPTPSIYKAAPSISKILPHLSPQFSKHSLYHHPDPATEYNFPPPPLKKIRRKEKDLTPGQARSCPRLRSRGEIQVWKRGLNPITSSEVNSPDFTPAFINLFTLRAGGEHVPQGEKGFRQLCNQHQTNQLRSTRITNAHDVLQS